MSRGLLTVAICTWNRARLLERTLASLTALAEGAAPWELLVVDNNSTDDTPQVLARHRGRLPLRVAFEPRPGLSYARNLAVELGQGEYFVWTDDDVAVEPDWLSQYRSAFAHHPEAAVFGGPVDLRFEEPRPAWLRRDLSAVRMAYAHRDLGPREERLTSRLPFGANFAIRAAEQRRHRYDPRLGVRAQVRRNGEESVVMAAILRTGSGWWVPRARVEHFIPQERQTLEYLERYYEGHGRSLVLARPPARGRRLASLARALGRWLFWALRYRLGGGLRALTRRAQWRGTVRQLAYDLVDASGAA